MSLNKLFTKLGSTFLLKVAIFVIGLGILVLCVLVLPEVLREAGGVHPVLPIIIVMYLTTIPFYIGLHRGLKLLKYIDTNTAFSHSSVEALRSIKHCAVTICVLYMGVSPSFYKIAQIEDAPGVMVIGLLPIFVSIIVAVLSAVLQKVLHNAILIKSENDLTV